MEYLLICAVAMAGSALTFFSGFGLGTVLLPAFALFFPVELAVALTAVVHFLNNVFKVVLVGKATNRAVVLRFGIPSLLASFAGAALLTQLSGLPAVICYQAGERLLTVTPVKLTIALVLAFFVLFDLVPKLSAIRFNARHMVAGGLLSGFFGGLSGAQGALRSAFLIHSGLSKEAFIASGVVIACMVDVARLAVYSESFFASVTTDMVPVVAAATGAAFAGAFVGSRLLKKITIRSLQVFVALMMLVFAGLLGAGII